VLKKFEGLFMIYVTGDFHGEFEKFKSSGMKQLKKNDILIVCGDFGFLWDGGHAEKRLIKKIGRLPYKVLFVEGSHENYRAFDEYPETTVYGGRARIIYGNLVLLRRGNIYQIEGKKIFAFGGGIGEFLENSEQTEGSIARLPTEEDMKLALKTIESCDGQVDVVVTHDCPMLIRGSIIGNSEDMNHLHIFLQLISEKLSFRQWYFGCYHMDKQVSPTYRAVYDNVVRVNI